MFKITSTSGTNTHTKCITFGRLSRLARPRCHDYLHRRHQRLKFVQCHLLVLLTALSGDAGLTVTLPTQTHADEVINKIVEDVTPGWESDEPKTE